MQGVINHREGDGPSRGKQMTAKKIANGFIVRLSAILPNHADGRGRRAIP